MEQPGSGSYPVVLYVAERNDGTFKGTTRYSTLGNGLLSVVGKIDGKGIITFTEEEALYGKDSVVSGCKYVSTIRGNTWQGVAHFTDGTKGTFILKLAD